MSFGVDYLQGLIEREITLATPMGVIVESANDSMLVLRAPLAPNSNHKGTAFGGSLYSLAVLAGWAWLTRDLATRAVDGDAVIQESSMRFLRPVDGMLRASVENPAAEEIDKFHKVLARAGRGRIRLRVNVHNARSAHDAQSAAAVFEGLFAAAMRR
jgi:thioesterase domain-containing protein